MVLDSGFTPHTVPRMGEPLMDVRAEAERARVRGYADGFAQGHRVGLERAQREQAAEAESEGKRHAADLAARESALRALGAARDELDERIGTLGEVSAARIEALAVELAEAILGVELSDPARSAAHAVRRALETVAIDLWVRVGFDERDARTLRDDPDAASTLGGIEIRAVPGLGLGSAIVEIAGGAVDTRVAEGLERARAVLDGDEDAESRDAA
ncbi:hypothetical protein GCM10009775_06970 [Microbacterium aoyamense]|uniref:Flagellar assembly protein FliH/Type III secretion system HrpE domain-containing protein n=2 Tax=Microbacterium aoyamense TaxID=344166 RepID=A0ABN2PCS6_9MICO